jgi:hypothetical protein
MGLTPWAFLLRPCRALFGGIRTVEKCYALTFLQLSLDLRSFSETHCQRRRPYRNYRLQQTLTHISDLGLRRIQSRVRERRTGC